MIGSPASSKETDDSIRELRPNTKTIFDKKRF